MLRRLSATKRRRTVAGDKSYETRDFIADVRDLGSRPTWRRTPPTAGQRSMVAQPATQDTACLNGSANGSKEPFGWIKTVGAGRKLRYIGQARNRAWLKTEAAVYNLIRICSLDAAAT